MNSILPFSMYVDELLAVKAEIARLQEREKDIRDMLVSTGEKSIDGILARASISYCPGREKIDWQTIAQKFEPSRQLITAHTTYSTPFHVVRVSARKGSK